MRGDPLEPGVNGAIVGSRDAGGNPGLRFQAPDGTFGPHHAMTPGTPGFLAAFLAARFDWRKWVDSSNVAARAR